MSQKVREKVKNDIAEIKCDQAVKETRFDD